MITEMSTKDTANPNKTIGLLLTEVAMGLLDHIYFDLDGRRVNDLQCLTKFAIDEEDYLKDDKDILSHLKISKNTLNVSNSCNITDTIVLDDTEDTNDNTSDKEKNEDEISSKDSDSCNSTNIEHIVIKENKNECLENIGLNLAKIDEESADTDIENEKSNTMKQLKLNPLLIKSEKRCDRVEYLAQLTQNEFLKIEEVSRARKRKFLKMQRNGKTKKSLADFYKEEKKTYEIESDALISFIKVVKKTEFPSDNPILTKLVSKISGDIMEAKKTIEWRTLQEPISQSSR